MCVPLNLSHFNPKTDLCAALVFKESLEGCECGTQCS